MLCQISRKLLPCRHLLPLLHLHHHLLLPSPPPNPKPLLFSSIPNPDPLLDPTTTTTLPLCPGCGVPMQSGSPSLPGFFTSPSPKPQNYRAALDRSNPIPLPSLPLSLKSGHLDLTPTDQHTDPETDTKKLVVCARCHSLRHYGRVKNPSAEPLLPDFDFDRAVAPKILSPSGARSLVLLLVDAADFDGSFPRKLSALLSASIDNNSDLWKQGKPANIPRVLLVVTKVDVLPSSVSPQWLDQWVRHQAYQRRWTSKLTGVHLVSSVKDWGVRNLVENVKELVGSRGNVWAIGAQNAGKSTLINAMGRCVAGRGEMSQLTEAPVPGTTLGIVRVEGLLTGQAKLFDTPGILHPYQITTRLTSEEQKLVVVGKEMRPRTYRIKAGYSVHIGGLVRVDVEELSVESIYLTVWASALLPLHMGRTENASKMMEEHFGLQLQPPIGKERVAELGKWMRREFNVEGTRWDKNSVDVAVAGLGWVSAGMNGAARLGVWTYEGVGLVARSSLVSERARIFEEAGFTISKVVSRADSAYNRSKHEKEKKKLLAS